jgi:hypothetical protein
MATLLACLCVATKLQSTDMTILDRGLVKDLQAACHKLSQGDRVRSLHELSKIANVSEG